MDGPINTRLAAYATALKAINPDFAEAVERLIVRLRANDCGDGAPDVGDVMPDFALPDDGGRIVRLDELLNKGPTAIMFHRGHWCPYRRINLAVIARHSGDIRGVGGNVVAVTPERQEFAAAFRSDAASPFPVLSDLDNGYALSLNLAIWVGRELEKMMAERGRGAAGLPGQRRLDAADPCDLCGWPGRSDQGAVRRSRLPHADGSRPADRGVEALNLRRAPGALRLRPHGSEATAASSRRCAKAS